VPRDGPSLCLVTSGPSAGPPPPSHRRYVAVNRRWYVTRSRIGVSCHSMGIQQNVAAFIMRGEHQPFCAKCVAKGLNGRNVLPIWPAMKDLAKDPGYRVEDADCSRCEQTTLTIRTLWTGF
jgi:hypothetical protein